MKYVVPFHKYRLKNSQSEMFYCRSTYTKQHETVDVLKGTRNSLQNVVVTFHPLHQSHISFCSVTRQPPPFSKNKNINNGRLDYMYRFLVASFFSFKTENWIIFFPLNFLPNFFGSEKKNTFRYFSKYYMTIDLWSFIHFIEQWCFIYLFASILSHNFFWQHPNANEFMSVFIPQKVLQVRPH